VQVKGQSTPSIKTINYFPPTITYITPTNSPTQGGVSLSISGDEFGFKYNITLLNKPLACAPTDSIVSQPIVCVAPMNEGVGSLNVSVSNQFVLSSQMVFYDPPMVGIVSPHK